MATHLHGHPANPANPFAVAFAHSGCLRTGNVRRVPCIASLAKAVQNTRVPEGHMMEGRFDLLEIP